MLLNTIYLESFRVTIRFFLFFFCRFFRVHKALSHKIPQLIFRTILGINVSFGEIDTQRSLRHAQDHSRRSRRTGFDHSRRSRRNGFELHSLESKSKVFTLHLIFPTFHQSVHPRTYQLIISSFNKNI